LLAAKRAAVRVLLDNCAGWTDANVTAVQGRVKALRQGAKAEGKSADYELKISRRR
jgi:hypothetical protein